MYIIKFAHYFLCKSCFSNSRVTIDKHKTCSCTIKKILEIQFERFQNARVLTFNFFTTLSRKGYPKSLMSKDESAGSMNNYMGSGNPDFSQRICQMLYGRWNRMRLWDNQVYREGCWACPALSSEVSMGLNMGILLGAERATCRESDEISVGSRLFLPPYHLSHLIRPLLMLFLFVM